MALVTIRRSSSLQAAKKKKEQEKSIDPEDLDDVGNRVSKRNNCTSVVSTFFQPTTDYIHQEDEKYAMFDSEDDVELNEMFDSYENRLNECYFANKGAALVLGNAECARPSPARALPQPDIQHHLQSMFNLLTPEDTLKMAVKLESGHAGRTRYLVVVCRGDEAALLGIDCNHRTSVGLVLRVLADTAIKLDGDGGFSVCVCSQQHIFKPVSVQAMWSALQTLHRASARARSLNHFAGGGSHAWTAHYEARIDSDRSCLNEWHAMDCIESRRPPSPDSLRLKPYERDETEKVIRCTLKEIMMSVDLDEVTSKVIRGRLEEELDMDLAEFKSFIDQEMLTILGQMDSPTEVFEHVYLGSEWNASNLDELQRNGVRHILNVTREIDNFFPGMFDYLNIRVYDDDKTDLLKHWDNTFKYINKAKNEGSKVLVHCKMGISRSASVVIAYAMKAYNWNFDKAWKHVKSKRSCIKPNTNFINQLETYQGILDAMKNKEKLQRSKSETNLKSPGGDHKSVGKAMEPVPLALSMSGSMGGRPRSWSPDAGLAAALLPPGSVSLERLTTTRHMLMPCAGGSYSVSPNQIIWLNEDGAPSVRHIVHEIERSHDRRHSHRKYARLQDRPAPGTHGDADGTHTWDPGDPWHHTEQQQLDTDMLVKSDSGIVDTKTKHLDVTLNLDCGLEKSEDKRQIDENLPPSRQNSWSSFDSAVVPDLSRQSSWGSYETRGNKHPAVAREDCATKCRDKTDDKSTDLSIISEQIEPLKSKTSLFKSSGNISDNEKKFNDTCAILKQLAEAQNRAGACSGSAQTWCGRLSVSAPAGGEALLRRRRRLHAASHGDLPRHDGIVTSLKREFEALAEPTDKNTNSKSLSASAERTVLGGPAAPASEDLSVKVLVDRYDNPLKAARCDVTEPADGAPSGSRPTPLLRNSFCGVVRRTPATSAERPPLAPTVLAMAPLNHYPNVLYSTVMLKAQNKKQLQHGKTHPLTRLNMNRSNNNRCSNSVYNTM